MIAFVLALAALPPLPPFPTEVRPRDGTTAPANAALFALGNPAPPIDQVGAAATVGGAPVPLDPLEAIGCCIVRARFADGAPALGDAVSFTFTSAAGESTAAWIAGPPDETAPTFTGDLVVIDHGQRDDAYEVIVGFQIADDTQVGMITAALAATEGSALVGGSIDGFVLKARVPGQRAPGGLCLDVVGFDVAENESSPETVCVTVAAPAEGEGEGEPSCSCVSSGADAPLGTLSLTFLVLAFARRQANSLPPR
jgi:hypothetical protein